MRAINKSRISSIQELLHKDHRSKEAMVNIGLSGLSRVITIISHLLIVSLTIHYLNQERYGIWLTLSSIIGWITFFDLGLSNGFRNRFAEAKALGNLSLAKQYLSTTYFALSAIVVTAFIVAIITNCFINWSDVLKVSDSYQKELNFVFSVVLTFTSINMIANIFISFLAADQKIGLASIIQALGQLLSLFSVYILSKTTEGSLTYLALFFSGIPCIVVLLVSVIAFRFSRYKIYRPTYKEVNFKLIRSICNIGVQFFIINICMIFIFEIVNIVISRELGVRQVSVYNITNKYFNVVYMSVIALISPFWSAFTDAYTKKDFTWMKKVYSKLYIGLSVIFLIHIVMIFISKYCYFIWIGDTMDIPYDVTTAMAISVFVQTYGVINMYLINGIGYVRLQTILYVIFALIAWPLFVLSCRWGIIGIISIPALVYLTQGIFGNIQLHKIINDKATGIWKK